MPKTDIDTLDISDTMKAALRECVVDPEGRVKVSKRTAKALEGRGLVQRGGEWIWVSAETAALYTDGPDLHEDEPEIEEVSDNDAEGDEDADSDGEDLSSVDALDPPEPVIALEVVVEPEPVATEPEPVVVEPEPAPEPLSAPPVVATEPEPVAVEPEPEPEPEPVFDCPQPPPVMRHVQGQSTVGMWRIGTGTVTSKGRIAGWGPSGVLMDDGSVHAVSDCYVRT